MVPVDLPGEKVVEATNSEEEETEELVPSKEFLLHSTQSSVDLSSQIKSNLWIKL